MSKKIRCVLIRHGLTQGNIEKRYIGRRTDQPLSEQGKELAVQKRPEYKDIIDNDALLISSPMTRARQTAALITGREDIHIIDELTETDFGDFEGKNHSELDGNERYQKWIDEGGMSGFPGGDDMKDYTAFVMAGFKKAIDYLNSSDKAVSGQELVIVCHGGTIMSIMHALTGKTPFGFLVNNLCGYVLDLELEDGKISCLSYDRIGDRIDIGSGYR
ncbi:MAG: histidine phosphatase family protein [Lachnospiraceae bacterium]|nr:histidine phosphatase family protein [Lachnospiraceae bacterium]